MQNTITQNTNARIYNHIYNSSCQTLTFPKSTGDFLMRASSDSPSPIIFLNNQLPDILLCISRELATLRREKSLCGKFPHMDIYKKAEPLEVWYRSILENTYSDFPLHHSNQLHVGQTLAGFSLRGEIYWPMTSYSQSQSQFHYVTLALPPLWQMQRKPTVFKERNAAPRFFSVNQKHADMRFFSFRYCSITGFWYVAVLKDLPKKFSFNELVNK
jgi:hypothetical protein